MREAHRWECAAPPIAPRAPIRVACVFEQAIGHVTFQANLARHMERWPDVVPSWHLLAYAREGWWPPRRLNWTLRAGLQARSALRGSRHDALIFHTHLPALLCGDHLRRTPTLLSMDATPAQNARLGIYVGSSQRRAAAREVTTRWVAQCAGRAYRVIAWSDWVRQSLVTEYGVPPEQVEVLPPGIDVSLWSRTRPASGGAGGGLPRILFVGGDFHAKGGGVLMQCFRRFWQGRAELHLVTRTSLPAEKGVVVHNGLAPNSPELVRLFRESDVFVLPTLGDTFAQVLLEAMASRLPVVASAVGGIPEIVVQGETGFLVTPRDASELFAAVEALIQDPDLRRRMGEAGYERARECYDIARNGRKMLALLHQAREDAR